MRAVASAILFLALVTDLGFDGVIKKKVELDGMRMVFAAVFFILSMTFMVIGL